MQTVEQKALALVNEVRTEYPLVSSEVASNLALCRAIEQHEAFRREVSDALSVYQKAASTQQRSLIWDALTRFIIPQPDPIAEAWIEATGNTVGMEPLNAALEARGLAIVSKEKS